MFWLFFKKRKTENCLEFLFVHDRAPLLCCRLWTSINDLILYFVHPFSVIYPINWISHPQERVLGHSPFSSKNSVWFSCWETKRKTYRFHWIYGSLSFRSPSPVTLLVKGPNTSREGSTLPEPRSSQERRSQCSSWSSSMCSLSLLGTSSPLPGWWSGMRWPSPESPWRGSGTTSRFRWA